MMKKIFLFFVGMFLVFGSFSQQSVLKYKALKSYKGNTRSYLQQNFEDHQSAYAGRTVGDLLKDIEMQPTGFDYIGNTSSDYCQGIYLFFESKPGFPAHKKFLEIMFDEPLSTIKSVACMVKTYPCDTWVTAHYDFFKDVRIKRIEYNPYQKDLERLEQ